MLQIDQQARGHALVRFVHQHAALLQQGLEALQHQVERGVEQRVPRRQQLRLRLAGDQGFVEGHTRVAVEHGVAAADEPIPVLQCRRHAHDLEAALLAL